MICIFAMCDSIPMGRQDVATGASPWTGIKNHGESRKDDMNPEPRPHVVPLGLKNAFFEIPPARARGYNLLPLCG